ncbi:hypothetical protein L1A00_12045 [Staphylococcus aureus]|uniref:hypothetical protein n=1 Tax=Staphylococcus aureus TaxID=1280 RepID=UPI001F2D8171|nr:hypothetical protein [Staphylococcus aureus]UIZ36155.1 hypothetical protein L1A00_12045 [Staphylococcus aureus]UIZ51462.1 hypothetical protein L0997_08715 [Staphylococcus aureus]
MLDNIILYFKNLPHTKRYVTERLKQSWKSFLIVLAACLILIIASETLFSFSHLTNVKEVRWLFRIIALIVFAVLMFTIYISYHHYMNDFLVTKLFNISAATPVVIMSILSFIMLVILTMISALVKPVNFETSYIALFYFIVMATIFVGLISVTFGLIRLLTEKINIIFYGVCVLCILLLPIIFIPNPNHVFINHILMLNPMYYIVNGIAQSIIFGISSMENIPYHFYFILFLCLIAAVNFVLARYTTHAIYNKTSKVTQTDNQQDVSNDSTDEADTSS